MHKWSGRDIVAIVLAAGVALTLVLLIAVEFVSHHGHVSDQEAAVLSTALGAVVGALATYLGADRNGIQPKEGAVEKEPDQPDQADEDEAGDEESPERTRVEEERKLSTEEMAEGGEADPQVSPGGEAEPKE